MEWLRIALVCAAVEIFFRFGAKPWAKRRETRKAREFRARLVATSTRKFDRKA